MFYKPEFRRALRERRKALSEVSVRQASECVAAQLIYFHPLQEAKNIAFYMPSEGEIDPGVFISRFKNKNYFLPVLNIAEKTLSFYAYHLNDLLVENKFSIPEPDISGKKPVDWKNLDIIFIPLVGFDKQCNRLGRGGGFYDRTLETRENGKKPLLIGLAYEFQKIEHIESSDWDIPLDFVATENEIYERRAFPIK